MAYETTTVAVEKSQADIRKLLVEFDAAGFAFGEESDPDGVRWALVQFAHGHHRVRLRVPHKPPDKKRVSDKAWRARTKSREAIVAEMVAQEERRIWRVLAWNLKARMVAVQEGVETFEEAFLAHLLDPVTGETVYEQLARTGRVELELRFARSSRPGNPRRSAASRPNLRLARRLPRRVRHHGGTSPGDRALARPSLSAGGRLAGATRLCPKATTPWARSSGSSASRTVTPSSRTRVRRARSAI